MDHPFSTAYSISKAGLIRFVGCLQLEVKDNNIQAFAVHPGEVGGTKLADIKYVTKDYVRKEAPRGPEIHRGCPEVNPELSHSFACVYRCVPGVREGKKPVTTFSNR